MHQSSSVPQPHGDGSISREHVDRLADQNHAAPIEEVIVQKYTAPAVPPTLPKPAELAEPKVTTRKRRGMQTSNDGDPRGQYPPRALTSDTRGGGPISTPPQPFIVQAVPVPPPVERPQPLPPTTPHLATSHHPTTASLTRTPRFPGGYASSSAAGQSDGEHSSSTAVQEASAPTPAIFSFPEPPAIEVYRPGSSMPSEMLRSRLSSAVSRNLQTSHASRAESSTAAQGGNRPSLRTMFSQYAELAPAASSATVAAAAKHAIRSAEHATRNQAHDPATTHRLASTSAVPDPLPSSYKRRAVVGEGEEIKHPVSAATLARRERKISASIAKSTPAARVVPTTSGVNERTRKTRAQKVKEGASSSSSPTTTSSGASSMYQVVNAGKKRSVEGHVVESPRIESTTEFESATDDGDKPSANGSAKKRRRVNDSPVEPSAPPVPLNVAKWVMETSKDKDEDSGFEDDESWSALDELKTPHRNALSLRSRTIFSEDAPSLAAPAPVPPLPRPALTIHIPAPPAKGKQTRPVATVTNTTTSTGLSSLSTIRDLTEVDALAGFAALGRRDAASQGSGSVRLGSGTVAERVPPIRVSRGNAAAAARGLRLRSAASRAV